MTFSDPPLSPRAVFFDLDGTLIDSLPDLVGAANALRKDDQLDPLPPATIAAFLGDGVRYLAARTITGRWKFDFSGAQLDHLHRNFIAHYQRHLSDKTLCYPGAAETLETLHEKGVALALITNKPELLAKKLLAFFRLAPFFRVVLGGDSLAEKKPHPLPLQETARRLDIPIDRTLMVGDSRNDLLAAKAAGSRTCLVEFGYGNAKQLCADTVTRPDIRIARLPDLLNLFT